MSINTPLKNDNWYIEDIHWISPKYNNYGNYKKVSVSLYKPNEPWIKTYFDVWVENINSKVVKVNDHDGEWRKEAFKGFEFTSALVLE